MGLPESKARSQFIELWDGWDPNPNTGVNSRTLEIKDLITHEIMELVAPYPVP